jgi:transcriptional regulator with XRE-family HTH domain
LAPFRARSSIRFNTGNSFSLQVNKEVLMKELESDYNRSSVGIRVRNARLRRGISQAELAAKAGCREFVIQEIENRGVSSKFMPAIAEALSESLEWLNFAKEAPSTAEERMPHFDLINCPRPAEGRFPFFHRDRLYYSPTGIPCEYTIEVDEGTVSRSAGFFRKGDTLFCSSPPDDPARLSWIVAWAPEWVKPEVARLATYEDKVFLSPPRLGELEFSKPVHLTTKWHYFYMGCCDIPPHRHQHRKDEPTLLVIAQISGMYRAIE